MVYRSKNTRSAQQSFFITALLLFTWLLTSILHPTTAFAFEVLHASKSVEFYQWGKYGYYIEDPDHTLSAEEVAQRKVVDFKHLNANNYTFGATQSAFWFRLEVRADTPQTRVISLADVTMKDVSLYSVTDKSVREILSLGRQTPIYKRDIIGA